MGKYTEALRKIEEERNKQKPNFEGEAPRLSFKAYAIGIVVALLIGSVAIFAYGVRRGIRSSQVSSASISPPALTVSDAPKAEGTSVVISPVGEVAESGENKMLLENLEKMMDLSYQEGTPTLKPESAQEPKPAETGEKKSNFYIADPAFLEHVYRRN